jgi:large subunit ribosomal protein L21
VYAIIAVGGKQIKVREGDTVRVERLPGEVGDTVTLNDVLLVQKDDGALAVGTPTVEGSVVTGNIVNHGRGKKIVIFKHKRRKNYRRKAGHRQDYTSLKIIGIEVEGKKVRRTKAAKQKESKPEDSSSEPSVSED